MSATTARQFFEAVRAASEDAERCMNELRSLEERALKVRGTSFDMRVRASSTPDQMAEDVAKLVTREDALRRRVESDYALVDEATALLYGDAQDGSGGLCEHLSPSYADILWWRYLGGATWEDVAQCCCYSARQCQRMHNEALRVIDECGLLRGKISA